MTIITMPEHDDVRLKNDKPISELLRNVPPEPTPSSIKTANPAVKAVELEGQLEEIKQKLTMALANFNEAVLSAFKEKEQQHVDKPIVTEEKPDVPDHKVPSPDSVAIEILTDRVENVKQGSVVHAEIDDVEDATFAAWEKIFVLEKHEYRIISTDNTWRDEPVETLPLRETLIEFLIDHNLNSLGQVYDHWLKRGASYLAFCGMQKGVGKAKAEKIQTALALTVPKWIESLGD